MNTLVSIADVLTHVPGIAPARIRLLPHPGTATVLDVQTIHDREDRLFELVDGILVEKLMGWRESVLAIALAGLLREFVIKHNLGFVSGEAGMIRLFPGLVRIPDVAFVSWKRIPEGKAPTEAVPGLVPDLVVEVLSAGNSREEMTNKRQDYFRAGVTVVWEIDPNARTLSRYDGIQTVQLFHSDEIIVGDPVLPGFSFRLGELFQDLDRSAPKA